LQVDTLLGSADRAESIGESRLTPHFKIVLASRRRWRFGRGTTIDLSFGPGYEIQPGGPAGLPAHAIVPRGSAFTAAEL